MAYIVEFELLVLVSVDSDVDDFCFGYNYSQAYKRGFKGYIVPGRKLGGPGES